MAKSKSFFGLRKGSTKTMTFSVLRGQQITKDRVTDIANPKTMDQTLQRIPFAQAVKFYKQATRGIFRFAYEDKKPLESDYNAFMRHNVKYASSVSIDNYKDSNYPAVGNWLLSAGSLPTPDYVVGGTVLSLNVGTAASLITTVGGISSQLLSTYPSLVEGDIVTFVGFTSELQQDGTFVNLIAPSMSVVQFVIDTNSTTLLTAIGLDVVDAGSSSLAYDNLSDETASAGAVIISRNTPSGLKVSEAQIAGNSIWNDIMEGKLDIQVREGDAYSWGAAEKAILQGSLSD